MVAKTTRTKTGSARDDRFRVEETTGVRGPYWRVVRVLPDGVEDVVMGTPEFQSALMYAADMIEEIARYGSTKTNLRRGDWFDSRHREAEVEVRRLAG